MQQEAGDRKGDGKGSMLLIFYSLITTLYVQQCFSHP